MKGGKGESERAREKEMKRRRERGTGAVDTSTANGRIIAPRTCLSLRWLAHKWDKPAHLYQSLLSFMA